jgi:hypothetical protein
MADILKRSSFGLVRTNPKLTTNIRIVADSKNRVFLESIDADPLLSKSIYKGFEVTGGTYNRDIYRFYSQGAALLPSSIAYLLKEKDDSTQIQDRYKSQYDFDLYCMGMEPKNSRLYSEEFSIFFPLWIEKDSIPDYFVIFKIDGPATINSKEYAEANPGVDLDTDKILNYLVTSNADFIENYLKDAKIIKTFDLTDNSSIGRYIRNHANDPQFPESSIYMSLQKGEMSYWNGIAYESGGFVKRAQDVYTDYVLVDKTITETDDFITSNFASRGVIHPNILNLEFLFDDPEQDKYKFSRYYGFYMSENELGKFEIDGNRLYFDRDYESHQLPRPPVNNIGYNTNISNQYQENEFGIKIYPKLGGTGGTSIYKGRLIDFTETQLARFPYVKDADSQFYSVNSKNNWYSIYDGPTGPYTETNFIRVKNTKVNWRNFTGFDKPFTYIKAEKTDKRGRPNFTFSVIDTVTSGDQIRIGLTDWTDPIQASQIDFHTIVADGSLPAGKSNGLLFSTQGSVIQVASAISSAINYIQDATAEYQIFSSVSIGNTVVVYARVDSENWNKIKYSLFSTSSDFPFSSPNEFIEYQNTTYLPSPIAFSTLVGGKLYRSTFTGGCDNPKARYIIELENLKEFVDTEDPVYIESTKGFVLPGKYTKYLEEPVYDKAGKIINFLNIDKYVVYQLEDERADVVYTSSANLPLYKTRKNTIGYLSVFPIKDFDFDFLDTTYSKDADSDTNRLYRFYTSSYGATSGNTAPVDYQTLTPGSKTFFDSIIGNTSAFIINKKFQKLNGISNDFLDENPEVFNEYDRLKETLIPEIALSSRVVPFINKWVYDNECTDVRENPYRLNTDQSFGYSNFSPSFDEVNRNTKFFTHEWYYLQKYPPYMSFPAKFSSYSYFDNDINFSNMPAFGSTGSTAFYLAATGGTGATANLLSIKEDYFLSYFTRETVDGIPVPRTFKYTLFGYGTETVFAETLFRGAKVLIKDRAEYSPINYNVESLRYLADPKYNGYRFSAILTYGTAGTQITVVKNDKWKSITMVIQADLNDPVFMKYYDNNTSTWEKFIDRSLLYAIQHKLEWDGVDTLDPTDVNLSGEIYGWTAQPNGTFLVYGRQDSATGTLPSFDTEITPNQNGGYNGVKTTVFSAGLQLVFQNITEVTSNTFTCGSIMGTGGIPTIYPSTGEDCEVDPNGVFVGPPPYYGVPASWFADPNFDSYYWPNTVIQPAIYDQGGWNAYLNITDQISFSSIANQVNSGSPEIKYVSVSETGEVAFDQFSLEISRPDYPSKATYLKPGKVKEAPQDLLNSSTTIGYEMSAEKKIDIHQLARYRGPYNPKWRNVVQFLDTPDIKSYVDIYGNTLEYNNVQLYIDDSNIFKIPNLFFNKVNVESPNVILRYSDSRAKTIFPLVGEIAIDKKDYWMFKTNWDPQYFDKYIKASRSVSQIGTREPKEKKAFFGSKTISIPNKVYIETFPSGTISKDQLGSLTKIKSVPQNIVKDEIVKGGNRYLNLRVYTTLALSDWLIADGIGEEFYKWIDPNYSFGNPNAEDDIKTYISENIYDRYIVKEVIVWEKFWKKGNSLPDIQTQLTDAEKIKAGYVKTKSFQTTFETPNDLNFQLIYNIPQDRNYSIAFTVVLEKK